MYFFSYKKINPLGWKQMRARSLTQNQFILVLYKLICTETSSNKKLTNKNISRSRSKTPATSKMELFVAVVNGLYP